MGAARSVDAPLGLQRHLTVPLFATSAVTGSGIPLLHAFLASLRSTAQQPAVRPGKPCAHGLPSAILAWGMQMYSDLHASPATQRDKEDAQGFMLWVLVVRCEMPIL